MINKHHILITAGATQEAIDPIRFISNHSTGSMGIALAEEALKNKLETTLICGSVSVKKPLKANNITAITAAEMYKKTTKHLKEADCIIMAAAVSDYTPEQCFLKKIKKNEKLTIKLKRTKDILKDIKTKQIVKVGFALETENLLENAEKKLKGKNLDLIIANLKTKTNNPFGEGKKQYTFLYKTGGEKTYRNKTKKEMAKTIIKEARRLIDENSK